MVDAAEFTPDKLSRDLREAEEAARKAVVGLKDDGSMSADHVHIPVGPRHAIPRKIKAFDLAAGGSYIRVGLWRGYLLVPSAGGVASVRLKACEVMAKVLADRGWGAGVYYQRD